MKSSHHILIKQSRSIIGAGVREETAVSELLLDEKINEFVLKLGYSNTHVLGILVQLLTRGKVRVDFRDYTERLELIDIDDIMNRQDAVALFDAHMDNLAKGAEADSLEVTQRIVIQPPRINLPRT
jgi:hypothetical protein